MFKKIEPGMDAFNALQKFCLITGGGNVYPRNVEIPFMMLDHPIEHKKVLVFYDSNKNEVRLLDWNDVLEFLSDIIKWNEFYSFSLNMLIPEKALKIGKTMMLKYSNGKKKILSADQYDVLRSFFDEKNPVPWEEIY